MLEIKANNTFVLTGGTFLQKISEIKKYWVFNTNNGDHFSLNETSFWVLEKIAEKLPFKKILARYLDHFEVTEEKAKADLVNIIKKFFNEKIIIKEEKK
jgi:hypothetical protein